MRRARSARGLAGSRWLIPGAAFTLAGLALAGGCGGRTGLGSPPPAPPRACYTDEDCGAADSCNPQRCQLPDGDGASDSDGGGGAAARPKGICVQAEPVDCDDNDPCTRDECDPATGACRYGLATLDSDGDGHRAPLPGQAPGAPDACGDDCNDTSAAAYPGGVEICDGVDNDCDGTVDNGATFVPQGGAVRVSTDAVDPAGTGGLAWSGASYAAVYTGTMDGFSVFRSMLAPAGDVLPPGEGVLTPANGDASGGAVVWVGDRYGVTWQDRRDGDYEVYFSLLDVNGDKVEGGDKRLTFAPGFSINASLAWNGGEFIPVWQDDRDGLFNLYAQRIDVGGNPIGSNVPLTDNSTGFGNEGPSVAAGTQGIGVTWTVGDATTHFIQFRTFSADLAPASPPLSLTTGTTESVYPTVIWNRDRYVVAWYDKSASPKGIYAAAVSEQGDLLTPPKPITNPGPFRSRYPFLRPLGDRVLAVYSDDRDQNAGYELYSVMVSAALDPIGPEQRLTFAAQDSVYPVAAFGPGGDVGILFRDDRQNGEHHMFFTRLGCVTTTP
ncbi:MAG: putative metal-binding motif-containing protein [Polyangiaceae bacterium]|nr:putative metal-binding motif-containing protein [Polyangiaceae bacterium]